MITSFSYTKHRYSKFSQIATDFDLHCEESTNPFVNQFGHRLWLVGSTVSAYVAGTCNTIRFYYSTNGRAHPSASPPRLSLMCIWSSSSCATTSFSLPCGEVEVGTTPIDGNDGAAPSLPHGPVDEKQGKKYCSMSDIGSGFGSYQAPCLIVGPALTLI
jgi:hypothetical protein